MTTEDFKKISSSLPKLPGIYRYLANDGSVLYVGKAKNLKNRLNSYFGEKKHQSFKTKTMIKHAKTLDFTIVDTEHDALLLESTLIKKYQPRYNVMLKDGKTYTYICIKNERFPRVFFTRRLIRDGSTYFGPYTSKFRAKQILELVKNLFPLRTCTYNLSESNINNGKFKVCLEYHIKNCEGPCQNFESEQNYNHKIEQIKNILKGNFKPVKDYIKSEMANYAEQLDYEKAQAYKEKLSLFENYQSRSTVVSNTIKDLDVFSISMEESLAYVNYLKVINGVVINTETIEMTPNLNSDKSELLALAILHLREKFNSHATEIVLPFSIEGLPMDWTITLPQRGDKKSLLEMSTKNVKYFLLQKQKEAAKNIVETPTERILKTIQKDLKLKELPVHIECFDNSNIQGTNPVSSCVVFRNGKPAKKDYRHFHIKTVVGANDFASMEEVVYRRYKRLLDEQKSLPQLIIIDGGKGQLSASVKSLKKLNILEQVTVIGIAKKLEEIFFPGDSIPLYINKKSESLKVIQHARNEAHRFAINFHRDMRSKKFLGTQLTEIEGIGPKTAQKILKHYGSINKLKETNGKDLDVIVNPAIAKKIITHFQLSEQ